MISFRIVRDLFFNGDPQNVVLKKAYVYQGYAFIEYENKQEAFCSVHSVRGLSEM